MSVSLICVWRKVKTQLKKGKSLGNDEIKGEMVSAGGEKLKEETYKLCKQVWKEGKVLEEWTKKGDLTECKNYRTIALMSHIGKVLMIVLLNRLKAQTEEYLADEQAGFRKDRSTVQQILMSRPIQRRQNERQNVSIIVLWIFRKPLTR